MSKLDEMKKNYQNIEIPEELKERVEKGIWQGVDKRRVQSGRYCGIRGYSCH